jgi:hypothetical protein
VSDIDNYLREARKLAAMNPNDPGHDRQLQRCNMYWQCLTQEDRAKVNRGDAK